MNPPYLKREDVPAAVLDEEKKIILAQMAEDPKMANKPEQVKEKIAAGKVGKYYGENCLLEQAFVKENKETVQMALQRLQALQSQSPISFVLNAARASKRRLTTLQKKLPA